MMKRLAAFLILICGVEPVWAQQDWTPTKEDIRAFEAAVHLPDWGKSTQYPNGHVPAPSELVRYYAGSTAKGHRIILAEFVDGMNGLPKPGIHIVPTPSSFPQIADGGCHIVHIRYDVDTRHIESSECNGFG